MQVDSEDARLTMPEHCDNCQVTGVPLFRRYYYGPGHNVTWHCNLCRCDHTWRKEDKPLVRTIALMLNEAVVKPLSIVVKNQGRLEAGIKAIREAQKW